MSDCLADRLGFLFGFVIALVVVAIVEERREREGWDA